MLHFCHHWKEPHLRVISGSAKGRRLASVPGTGTRPITDRVKESLFNIVGPDVVDSTWLDLFGGTGSVGIEALSRGAAQVLFIDKARVAVDTIRKNLDLTGLVSKAKVLRADAFAFVKGATDDQIYDYVYVAPPQYKDMWAEMLAMLDEKPLLADGGVIIVQIYPKEYHEIPLKRLVQLDERHYGDTVLYFYREKSVESSEV